MAAPRSSYLLTDIPIPLRTAMSRAAEETDSSLQGVILAALYGHYGLEAPKRGRYVAWMDRGAHKMVIRAETELFEQIRRESEQRGETMRETILTILQGHLLRDKLRAV